MDTLLSFLPLLITLLVAGVLLRLANWLLLARRPELGNERRLPRHFTMIALGLVGLVAVVLALPVDEGARNQIIGLIGLLLSGAIAFSSSNILANLMAGVMLRLTRSFRTGDYIRVEGYFGRVTERGLFDVEVQTETRELISVPNAHLITHPHTVVRSSGTIVSASLSLGYDVHHARIEELLLQAAHATGLSDPFVHIMELGDFSVTYRISGLLTDVKTLLTTRSNLHRSVLDALHEGGIEIVSPTFMNQRQINPDARFIPATVAAAAPAAVPIAEEVAFDKAEQAEQEEHQRDELEKRLADLEARLKDARGNEKQRLLAAVETTREQLEALNGQPELPDL